MLFLLPYYFFASQYYQKKNAIIQKPGSLILCVSSSRSNDLFPDNSCSCFFFRMAFWASFSTTRYDVTGVIIFHMKLYLTDRSHSCKMNKQIAVKK